MFLLCDTYLSFFYFYILSRCDCTQGYAGPLCQHNLNECESSPCVHGICVDQEDGFRCFCQPGEMILFFFFTFVFVCFI